LLAFSAAAAQLIKAEGSRTPKAVYNYAVQAIKNLVAIILLPGMVTVLVPWLILAGEGPRRGGWGLPAPWWVLPVIAGPGLILAGLALVFTTISLFIRLGRGTLAPWAPPARLVIQGPYRHVRNPMISGVLAILLGEALLFGSLPLVFFFLFAAALNMVYIPLSEEPGLERRFGESYRRYKRSVPRWIPRLQPWMVE
jgi:protein-S-isoprenylcysteine O-methyltransferase Ste14